MTRTTNPRRRVGQERADGAAGYQEVPYSTASSEERYHGTDGGSRSRAKTTEPNSQTNSKTSALVPEEVGYRKTSTMVPRLGLVNSETSTK